MSKEPDVLSSYKKNCHPPEKDNIFQKNDRIIQKSLTKID